MTGLYFFTDHRFMINKENIYSATFSPEVFNRYTNHFGNLNIVASYTKHPAKPVNQEEIKSPSVKFLFLEPLKKNLYILNNYKDNKKKIFKYTKKASCTICRLPSTNGLIAASYAISLKKPFIIELVGDIQDILHLRNSLLGKIYGYYQYKKIKSIVKKSNYTIYVSDFFLQKKYPTSGASEAISNVEINHSPSLTLEKKLLLISMFDPRREIKLAMIGAPLNKRKGMYIAIKSLRYLRSQGYNITLNIIGQGKHEVIKKKLKEHDCEKFIFYDGILSPGEEVSNWLRNHHIYIQPSLSEGLPRALIEAMNQALPCVASNISGIPELLRPDFLVAPADHIELSNILTRLINSKNLQSQAAQFNFNKAQRYDQKTLQEKRSIFFKKFIRENKID